MAILKNILCGFLALVLALPSPTLCYADDVISAGGGDDYVQTETKTEEGNQEGSQEQQQFDPGSAEESSEDGAVGSISANSNDEEGLTNGNFGDITSVRSNGFDPSLYPSEYSDPSFNIYLDYSRDDLQETIKAFYDLSESRDLTDDENEQVTLALFAWFYLDYGSTDDLVQAAVSSDWIISSILGSFAFSTKDLFYGIWYMFYGTPSSWGASPPFDVYSKNGLVWFVANIDSKLSSIYSQLTNTQKPVEAINTRVQSVQSSLSSIISHLGNSNDYLSFINRVVEAINTRVEDLQKKTEIINGRIENIQSQFTNLREVIEIINGRIEDLQFTSYKIRDFLSNLATVLEYVNGRVEDLQKKTETINVRIENIQSQFTNLREVIEIINGRIEKIQSYLFDSSTNRPLLQVIGDRLTAFMYQIDASQNDISGKLDSVAKDETVSSGFNNLNTGILLYLIGNNDGFPVHTEYLDNGLIYYIVQIHDLNKELFDKALEYFEYFKERLFYIEYDLVDYGSDIEPGFNRLIEAINTKEFNIQLDNAAVNINLSGVESRLDTIIAMLGVACAKDLLETFLGDFNFDASSALASSISAAMQNVFPFCLPAILKQCLGLLQTEGAPPVFNFDVFGAPLVLDFTANGLSDLSQITAWICRISFLILLLVNTKKFIFSLNRGTSDG